MIKLKMIIGESLPEIPVTFRGSLWHALKHIFQKLENLTKTDKFGDIWFVNIKLRRHK